MEFKQLNEIRKLVIIALFSDDDLMEVFVLKGGNAISLVYGMEFRSSQDIDVSIATDFEEDKLEEIKQKLSKALMRTFSEHGYKVFDITFSPQPVVIDEEKKDFWGGYRLEFKIIDTKKHEALKANLDDLRRQAIPLSPQHDKKFKVDISKHEYCDPKEPKDLEGHRIYVYTPVMVIYEKLRAICQQMEPYKEIVPTHQPRRRGRDFFDIYMIKENWYSPLDLFSSQNLALLESIFKCKMVPLELLKQIRDEKEFHRLDFQSVKDTVTGDFELKGFDFYFDYVVDLADNIINALEHKDSSDR